MADTTPPKLPQALLDELLRGASAGESGGRNEGQDEGGRKLGQAELRDDRALVGWGAAMVRVDDPTHQAHRGEISEDLLADFAEGLLEEGEHLRVGEIVAGCHICQSLLEGIRYELGALDGAAAGAIAQGEAEAEASCEGEHPSTIGEEIWREGDPLGTDDKEGRRLLEIRIYWGDMLRDCRYLTPKDGPLTLGVGKDDLFINPTHLPSSSFPLVTPRGQDQVTLRFSPSMTGYVERQGIQTPLTTLITSGDATPEAEGAVFALALGHQDRFVLRIGGERLTGTFIHGHKPLARGFDIDLPFAGGLGALALAVAMALVFLIGTPQISEPVNHGAPGRFAQRGLSYGGEGIRVVGDALSPEQIDEEIQASGKAIQTCFTQGLEAEPSLSGEVFVRFTIGADGAVAQAEVERSTLDNPAVERCVVEGMAQIPFPKPEGGVMVTVVYPIRFNRALPG